MVLWEGRKNPSALLLKSGETDSLMHLFYFIFFQFFFFNFFFIFKLYKIVLVLPNIKMNPPQVYMCSPS